MAQNAMCNKLTSEADCAICSAHNSSDLNSLAYSTLRSSQHSHSECSSNTVAVTESECDHTRTDAHACFTPQTVECQRLGLSLQPVPLDVLL
eukprot:5410162-Amphidinium_carterae.1